MGRPRKPISPGTRFGRVVVISEAEGYLVATRPGELASASLCKCDCGKTFRTRNASLFSGATTSCGCFQAELRRNRAKHRKCSTPEYRTWSSMRERCNNPNCHAYASYGGRAITVCERWNSFEVFLSDMGVRPEGCSLDRIDNNKGYSPENCRLASNKQQMNNRRSSVKVQIGSEVLTVAEWCDRFKIKPTTVWSRVSHGASFVDAITKAARPKRKGNVCLAT